MTLKPIDSGTHIKLREPAPPERFGGENWPIDYPHLYQIQAGDWRISYAVERNHLAILVLEVLNPDGSVREDPARETLTRKMKVKLLDWPEGSPSRDLPPEDLGRKIRIKLLDLVDEASKDEQPERLARGRVKLAGSASPREPESRITIVDAPASDSRVAGGGKAPARNEPPASGKITPLDSPSM